MMYQKELKRNGHIYAEILTEEQVKELKSNPHTSRQFRFVPVASVAKANILDGSTPAKRVKKAEQKTEKNQENEFDSHSGVSGPLQENV